MASTYLSRTFGSPTNNKIWTMSTWLKRGSSSAEEFLFSSSASYREFLRFESTGEFTYRKASGSSTFEIKTNRKFLDTNSWYHFVVAVDTTQSTDTNKYKLYVNGVQETSFATASYMSTDYTPQFNGGHIHTIGRDSENSSGFWLGSMSHFHFCDGTQLAPTVFGSTDNTTGEWNINTSPSFTLGNNGFSILKDGDTITDQSSNSNAWTTAGGVVTKTEDNPSNNFATMNFIMPTGGGFTSQSSTFSNGNTQFATNNSSSNYGVGLSSLGMNVGKYYAECKLISGGQGLIGIRGWQGTSSNNYLGDTPKDYGMYTNGRVYRNDGNVLDTSVSYTTNDIIGVFVDCDNWKVYWSKNGAMMNTTGLTIGNVLTDTNARSLGAYFFGCCEWNSTGNGTWQWNFGNGAFGSAPLTGTTYDGSDGQGIFKYNPKNLTLDSTTKSFKALCTKGLNS